MLPEKNENAPAHRVPRGDRKGGTGSRSLRKFPPVFRRKSVLY